MSIILIILKVIGIILLTLLLLMVLGISLMLFLPVRYQVKTDYEEKIDFNASFSWFFRIVNGKVIYKDNKFQYFFKLFGKTLYPATQKIKKEKNNHKKKIKHNADSKNITKSSNKNIDNSKNDLEKINSNEEQLKINQENIKEPIKKETYINDIDCKDKEDTGLKESFLEKINRFFKKLFNCFVHIKCSLLNFYGKIKHVIDNIEYYRNILESENTKIVFKKVSRQIYKVYLRFKPKKFSLKLHLGFGDNPDIQGSLLAIHGMLYPFHRGKIELEPDFETEKKEIHLFMKGKIQSYVLIKFFHLYFFDKNVKELKGAFENRGGV